MSQATQRLPRARRDRLFDIVNAAILVVLSLIVCYPLYFVVIASFSDPSKVQMGEVVLYPIGIQWDGYLQILQNSELWTGYGNTLLYTFFATILNLVLTLTAGFALSNRSLPGRKWIMRMLTFTMFFSGGMIPTYIVVRSLGLLNTRTVMILMGAVNVWNLILARSFFEGTIPTELRDAAFIDGCSYIRFFISIVLPVSGAIIAVLTVYYAVAHWNQYMNAIIYLRNRKLMPLQVFLRELLIDDQFNDSNVMMDEMAYLHAVKIMSMKYGVIIVSSLPVLVLYPFVQKYFVKGVMVGSVKG